MSGHVSSQSGTQLPGVSQQLVFSVDTDLLRVRTYMQEKIFYLLAQSHQQPVNDSQMQKLRDIVKRLEEGLFKSAHSKEEYMNLGTLESRLHNLIKRPSLNNRNPVNPNSRTTMIPTPGLSHNGSTTMMATSSVDAPMSNMSGSSSMQPTNANTGGLMSSGVMHSSSFKRTDGSSGFRTIGKISVSDTVIGKGSNGTIVVQGLYEHRSVAVKRLVKHHHDVAFIEIDRLIVSDRHPNIIRYYGVESDQDFVYLALQHCTCSLYDLIQACANSSNIPDNPTSKLGSVRDAMQDVKLWRADGRPSPLLLKVMRDVVSGLAHLHALGIIHRDLKPQNILITKNESLGAKNESLGAQLSDMGISRCLPDDKSSLGYHSTGCGSSGWRAPEQLIHGGRQTLAMDIFSLGCVFFFCVTGGGHPFGETLMRDCNILNDTKNLSLVEFIPEAADLFLRLLRPRLELRPKASEVLHHPFFWSSNKRLFFLSDVSARVESEAAEVPNSDFLKELENIAPKVFEGNWLTKIDTEVMANLCKWRKYNGGQVRDLLRAVRNQFIHHMEASKEVKRILGLVPDGLDAYFARQFPRLLIESCDVVSRFCKKEECFEKYFPM